MAGGNVIKLVNYDEYALGSRETAAGVLFVD